MCIRDRRFSKQTARKVYEKLYTQIDSCKDKKECEKIQNQYWYAIYQKYESQAQIYMAQRDFLLLRDMTIMTVSYTHLDVYKRQVYLWYKGQYYATKLTEVNSEGYYLTGWYDNFGCAAGKLSLIHISG